MAEAVLLDTHAWVWSFADPGRLSARARAVLDEAAAVAVSPISFFEIGQKVRTGKWPEMAPFAADLPAMLRDQGGVVAALTPEICLRAALAAWDHRDPFDRLLAATAEATALPLISRDAVFDARPGVVRVW